MGDRLSRSQYQRSAGLHRGRLQQSRRLCLIADRMIVDASMFLNKAQCTGEVRLPGAAHQRARLRPFVAAVLATRS
jgi:hypothetical protein